MFRPNVMPTVQEQCLFDMVVKLNLQFDQLTTLLANTLPTSGIRSGMFGGPNFDNGRLVEGGNPFYVSECQPISQLTREAILMGLGPKFKAAYLQAQGIGEREALWRQLRPISGADVGRVFFELYFHNPWYANEQHDWISAEHRVVIGSSLKSMQFYPQVYEYFIHAPTVVGYEKEEQRALYYSRPNDKLVPQLFDLPAQRILAIPVRHYNGNITPQFVPFHSAYLLFNFEKQSYTWSKLGCAHWCEIEQCWLETFENTNYLSVDEVQCGVEAVANFLKVPAYVPVDKTKLRALVQEVENWIHDRERGVDQSLRLKGFNYTGSWEESARQGCLELDLPRRDAFSLPTLLLYPDADRTGGAVEVPLFINGRESVWDDTKHTRLLPHERLWAMLQEELINWLAAAKTKQFDKHTFYFMDSEDGEYRDPEAFFYEYDPAREAPKDAAPNA